MGDDDGDGEDQEGDLLTRLGCGGPVGPQKLPFTDHFQCARHYARSLTCITSFQPP